MSSTKNSRETVAAHQWLGWTAEKAIEILEAPEAAPYLFVFDLYQLGAAAKNTWDKYVQYDAALMSPTC